MARKISDFFSLTSTRIVRLFIFQKEMLMIYHSNEFNATLMSIFSFKNIFFSCLGIAFSKQKWKKMALKSLSFL